MIADSETMSRQRKESQCVTLEQIELPTPEFKFVAEEYYPFALVLRLRVLQIVCGITLVIMGTVAFIEEKGEIRMGLGMPAGILTVFAAGMGIHTSRGFSGYKEPSCTGRLRFLGPRPAVAFPLTVLRLVSLGLQLALLAICADRLTSGTPGSQIASLAWLLLGLSSATLVAAACILRIDCTRDPD
ncbi:Hypothetical protein NTJ_10178 [Nesidiocoris tenuis]|uniref:Uncharacterized protein n=1 Tax=Nesidiocoris tenuis TaxID=355587 RepID=A0ABN7B1C6_9HEMI|nr:Hypothetical protein NTJ_10178 [Nesidiocoris tenuis]